MGFWSNWPIFKKKEIQAVVAQPEGQTTNENITPGVTSNVQGKPIEGSVMLGGPTGEPTATKVTEAPMPTPETQDKPAFVGGIGPEQNTSTILEKPLAKTSPESVTAPQTPTQTLPGEKIG